MNILGIESSCDETAAAVVSDARLGRGPRLRSSIVASQLAVHRPFGGVVPELASRSHVRFITDVMEEA
ncbi:MAG: tRNA (adenosine(37)-N6)-threonylcarbamoyltransferase complex transferase subunit TsaD, partial [bacterium]